MAFLAVRTLIVLMLISTFANAANKYDYLQLVQQWPKTFCHNNQACIQGAALPELFSIHGMWPSNFSGQNDACVGTRFSMREMRRHNHLETQLLSSSWPSYTGLSNGPTCTYFWEYEYNKHGTCSENNLKQTDYFTRADALWRRYNVTNMLLTSRHQMSPGSSYRYADILNAIRQGIGGYTPLILCKKDRAKNNLMILHEVIICFDPLGNNVIACGRRSVHSCSYTNSGLIDYPK